METNDNFDFKVISGFIGNMKNRMWLMVCIAFAIGIAVGYFIHSEDKSIPSDELVAYLEQQINEFPPNTGNSFIGSRMTLDDLKLNYIKYKPISTGMLVYLLSDICSNDWKNASILPYYNELACSEMCAG